LDPLPLHIRLIAASAELQAILAQALYEAGFQLLPSPSVEQADLVVLGGTLPAVEALAACQQAHQAGLPVLLAATSDDEAARGVAAGADEYVIVPCSRQELALRVQLALRHSAQVRSPLIVGDLSLDLARHHATAAGQPLPLTATEFRLLSCLVANVGRMVPWQQLLREAWLVEGSQGGRQMVKTGVYRLRRKLRHSAVAILTVRGAGYMLTPGRAA